MISLRSYRTTYLYTDLSRKEQSTTHLIVLCSVSSPQANNNKVVKTAHHFFITICAASGSGGMEVKMINQKLRGQYQYYGVTDNTRGVKSYLNAVKWLLYKWLNRRSQKRSYTLDIFYNGLLKTFPLLEPMIRVSLFYR